MSSHKFCNADIKYGGLLGFTLIIRFTLTAFYKNKYQQIIFFYVFNFENKNFYFILIYFILPDL